MYILVHELQPHEKFLICIRWLVSNQESVKIVNKHPHWPGAARMLFKAALKEAVKKREVQYADLKKIKRGVKHHFHDDLFVIVMILDHKLMRRFAANNAVAPVGVLHSHSVSSGQ